MFSVLGLSVWLLLYIWGGATSFQPADSAEFLTVAATGGIAHPPGYPLYTLLGIIAVRVLPGNVLEAMSLLAALISWLTVIGIYTAVLLLCRQRFAAFFAACIGGVSLHIWTHATHPEVFALLGCFAAWLSVAAILGIDPMRSEQHRRWAWYFFALLAGLASAHHHTIVFSAPIGLLLLYYLFIAPNTRITHPLRTFGLGTLLFVCGLTPYLYLLLVGSNTEIGSWGEIRSFSDLFEHFLRREFGTFQSGIYRSERPFWYHTSHYLQLFLSWTGSFPFGLAALCLLGGLVSISRKTRHIFGQISGRWRHSLALMWILSWLLAGVAFPCLLQMGTSGLDRYVAARFFLLPDVYLAMLAGLGLKSLCDVAHCVTSSLRTRKQHRYLSALPMFSLYALLSVALISAIVLQYPRASSQHRQWLETYARDLLRELPPQALLLEASDEATCFGIVYLQRIVKLRQDVRFVCLPLLGRAWYAKQLSRTWPEFDYQFNPKNISSTALIAHYLRLQRPVHSTELYNQTIQMAFHWLPHGLSWRVWPHLSPLPSPDIIEKHLHTRYQLLRPQHPLPHPQRDAWPAFVMQRYARPWQALAHTYTQLKYANRALDLLAQQLWPSLAPPPPFPDAKKAAKRCYQRAKSWSIPATP